MRALRRLLPGCVLLAAASAAAQTGDDLRGGWTAEIDGQLQVFLLKVRDDDVTGVHCVSDCRNPSNLALIEGGRFDGATLTATIYVDPSDAAPYRDRLVGRWLDGHLAVERRRQDGTGPTAVFELTKTQRPVHRPGAGRAAANAASGRRIRPAYAAPGPPERLTPRKVAGLWIAGAGPGKQNFIFRTTGDRLYGLVCGPCDDTNAMAPLDSIVIDGTTLRFNIVHEDWGIGIEQGVFNMLSVGSIAANELHFTAVRDTDPTGRIAEMTLLGPVRYQSLR